MGIYLNQSKTSLLTLKFNKSKNYLFDLDKLDIFEKYRSNYIGIVYLQHYQTAGADVEATVIGRLLVIFWTPPPPPPMGRVIFFIQCSFIFTFQKCQVFENLIDIFLAM